MSAPTTDEPMVAASCRAVSDAAAVATLHRLNAGWIRSFLDCDAAWYSEHLGDDFICVLADGRRTNKHEFLRHLRESRAETVDCDEVDVHLLGDAAVALVRGVIHLRGQALTLLRYTMLWQAKPERWQAVAAQFTPLEREHRGGKKRRRMIISHRASRNS
jgi:ketosteroid isomerase-like protein